MCGDNRLFSKFLKWCDELKLAFLGLLFAFKNKRFVISFLLSFFFFGTLLNLLVSGSATLNLLLKVDFLKKIEILWRAFLGIFGFSRNFYDFLYIFVLTFIQATLISLVVLVYKYRKNSANIQNAGIVTGLIILGSGCPTCGTTLLAPIIISLAGSSGMAMAGTTSMLLTILSLILAFFTFKKVGFEAYIIFKAEKFNRKKGI
jgi:hypothetical protein